MLGKKVEIDFYKLMCQIDTDTANTRYAIDKAYVIQGLIKIRIPIDIKSILNIEIILDN